jgi:hypothetical protein
VAPVRTVRLVVAVTEHFTVGHQRMIHQRPGDLLEIQFEGKLYYIVVLKKVVMFGGNIVFAYHGDESKRASESLTETSPGFNICTDLFMPKKEGTVRRVRRFEGLFAFWRTQLVKGTNEWRVGYKAKKWIIYKIDDLQNHIERRSRMPSEYAEAMDDGLYSFDLVVSKILEAYTPSKNPFL